MRKARVEMMRAFVVLAIGLVALSACGGGAAPAAQASAATTATIAPAAATQAAAATASGPSLLDLLKSGKATTYKVTYTWTITTGGQTTTAQQTWYAKAPNTRFDYSLGQGASFSVFSLPDGTFVCTAVGGSAFCQKSSGQAAFGQNPTADLALQLQDKPDQFNASFTGAQTIAGQQAQCYTVRSLAGAGFGDVTSCYSSNGVPLKTTISAQGSTMTMEATAFSTAVSDADFKLPGPVR